MKINMFEGARRSSLVVGALWVFGCIYYTVLSLEPYVQLTYTVSWLNAVPTLAEECPSDAATEYLTRETPDGSDVSLTLCFLASRADSGKMLVPYADAGNGKVWMGDEYSTEVSTYTERVAQTFRLTPEGIEGFKSKRWEARLESWEDAAKFLFGGLAVGWLIVAGIGWIVRGFMGIPRGKDTRPPEE